MKPLKTRTLLVPTCVSMLLLLAITLLGFPDAALGEDDPFNKNKPFAEHFLVLQISDADPAKQREVLSVASNVMKYYGQDLVDIEIVAFAGGIGLVFADNENEELINSLIEKGVRFDGCMNTIDTIVRKTGIKPELNPNMIPVRSGVAHILELTEQGYTLVRP